MNVIELKNIKKTYHLEKLEVPVLFGMNLTIKRGEFVIIMGQSGSGKSTLLNILGLLDKPSEGSFKLAGIEVSNYIDSELASLRNRYLGFVFQQFNLLGRLSAYENTALPLIYSNSTDLAHRQDPSKLLKLVGLSDRAHHKPNELSGGQQQRVAIARALVNNPLVLFADEPTGNLDTKSTKEIIQILRDLNESGITVIMVTHEPELALYASRIIKLEDGLIISDENLKPSLENKNESNSQIFKKKNFSFSRIKDYFLQAFGSLWGNKVRSILSILGVMIGVASLIAMLAVGKGAQKSVQEQVESLGSNLLTVSPGAAQRGGISAETGARLRLIYEDIDDLQDNVEGIEGVAGIISGRAQVVANGKNYNARIQGSSFDYERIRNIIPLRGRWFSKEEELERKRVVLLGRTVITNLYGDPNYNPIGEYVKIDRNDFQVIGVMPIKGSSGWRDEDDLVMLPLLTALYRLAGTRYFNLLNVQVKTGADMNETGELITQRLLLTHRFLPTQTEAVQVRNMAEIQEAVSSMAKAFSLLLGSIAFISLLVGGIGIMNIMFVSVSERTKEIGLRKAVGANNKDILFQFILESIFVCCSGGIIGIIFGVGVSVLISAIADWTTSITIFSIVLAFIFSVTIGLIFGVFPARKASLLNPIDALRHD
ncbi:MAG: ABC transporter permease [Elusimicrobiota bacterium]|jgi:macrolide transport system ATP-binding/permease protein|nr:ABC transporter permease [Elusimicrobiota bacterium]